MPICEQNLSKPSPQLKLTGPTLNKPIINPLYISRPKIDDTDIQLYFLASSGVLSIFALLAKLHLNILYTRDNNFIENNEQLISSFFSFLRSFPMWILKTPIICQLFFNRVEVDWKQKLVGVVVF